jgi:threonine dehydrogenase-like Zn-dependent dehydrogenase
MPFPGEAFGCALNIFQRATIDKSHTVGIVGIGFLGACLTQLCSSVGARVIALARRAYSLDLAERCGASELVLADDSAAAIDAVRSLTRGALCDRVIEATGFPEPLSLAAQITAHRGRLVIAGYHQDGPREVDMQLWNWRGFDVINAHERNPHIQAAGIRHAISAIDNQWLRPHQLGLRSFSFDHVETAFSCSADSNRLFTKAVVLL